MNLVDYAQNTNIFFARAPLFEIQTDDWECFCAIHWDPLHADCAVPQVISILSQSHLQDWISTIQARLSFS
jgi:hypothetical protein